MFERTVSRARKFFVGLACAAATVLPGWAFGLPAVGDAIADASVEDADGGKRSLAQLAGKPYLVVYEDKDSAQTNQTLKDELSKLAQGDKFKNAIGLLAVADVSDYDFWPVKGFVKDAIREESKKAKTTIYCDWTGTFREKVGIQEGTSTVLLVGGDGKVRFAKAGALSKAERAKLVGLLRAEVGGP